MLHPVVMQLRDLRIARGWTKTKLAAKIGGSVSVHTISKIELGKVSPLLSTLSDMAQALGCDLQVVRKQRKE